MSYGRWGTNIRCKSEAQGASLYQGFEHLYLFYRLFMNRSAAVPVQFMQSFNLYKNS